MTLPIYQVDAFTSKLFGGNPAAVVPLQDWISDKLMQQISLENNVSDTAFFVPHTASVNDIEPIDFDIRWFTPSNEINLCGHATLATAYLLFHRLGFNKETILFSSPSGLLRITQQGNLLSMDFPSWKPVKVEGEVPPFLKEALGGVEILGMYKYRDLVVEVPDEDAVRNNQPDFTLMKKYFDKIIITAKGEQVDFVSRFYGPAFGVDEDPVTGSAHSQLIPFWGERLGKTKMNALQLSARGGELTCEQLNDERVLISGQCVFYMKGEIEV